MCFYENERKILHSQFIIIIIIIIKHTRHVLSQ
jgi:hypothetical protein